MTVRLVRPYRQTGIQQQDATVCPGGEETAFVGRRLEGRVVDREGFVNVCEGRGRVDGRADGEAEAVGLVDVVIGVLAEDYGFDCGEGGVSGPR